MTKGRQCALIICLGLVWLAFGLRLWRLDAQPLHGDEAFSVLFSSYPLGEMFQSMGTTEPNPPLYWLTLRAWMSLAGRSEFAVRFLSVLFSTATVALLYPFGQRLFGQRIGVLVAFLGAINPFYLWYAQETRMYTMVAALSLASLVFFLGVFPHVGAAGPGRPSQSHRPGRDNGPGTLHALLRDAHLAGSKYPVLPDAWMAEYIENLAAHPGD
jgi:predicted membrane-bound mannosyltransferase